MIKCSICAIVARPQSNKIVCYYLNLSKKNLHNSEAMTMKSKFALSIAEKKLY